ncbi:MAG: hypothetical protein Q7R69_00165 [bacterium]|nr:hypothetical protein [bacterium]
MKHYIKKFLPPQLLAFIRDIFYPEKINILEERLGNLFLTYYQGIADPNLSQKIAFKNAEFKVYSKHGGDGILALIFSKIGMTNCIFVEVGVEDGTECNTANLSRNFGWNGLLIDANEEWVKRARDFYQEYKVKVAACLVTAENINQLLQDNGIGGEIDLLSIDIDGNDYWVWEAINVINPRVVVMEYNTAMGHRSLTIPYNPARRYQNDFYYGASLRALSKLAIKKGYNLVACDSHGLDAFFVRRDVAQGKFREVSPEEAFYHNPYTLKRFGSLEEQFSQIKHLDFEEI